MRQFSLKLKRPHPERPLVGGGRSTIEVCHPPMSDDEDQSSVTYRRTSHMDEAFCERMRAAIDAGLESTPVGVITTPGTKNPRYVPSNA